MYHALYRKYRPQTFSDVVGQDVIVKTLKNSIINDKFGHAYMFIGPRGTGKTTLSKIFARSINCINPIDGESCGKCSNCLCSYEKECVDIIEMDAASNNGVDEIRELRNKISLVPSELKYKVYIIDEVHMLSIGAFNALLKTLEEPPAHAVFILATTDPQKVPDTIVSRCQSFSFKRISENNIVDKLRYIAKEENINVDDDVLKEIAIVSAGGLRDAIGLLDKMGSYSSGKITYDDFVDLNGMITKKDIGLLCDSIFSARTDEVLRFISDVDDGGKNIISIFSQIMYFLRDKVVDYYVNKNKEDVKKIENYEKLINIINEKMFDIKKSENPKIYIEVLLLNFIEKNVKSGLKQSVVENVLDKKKEEEVLKTNPVLDENVEKEVLHKKDELDKNSEEERKEKIKTVENFSSEILNISDIMNVRVNNTLAKANKKILKEEIEKLNILNDYTFDQNIGYLVCEILNSKFRVASSDCIVISYEYDSIVKQNLKNLEKITQTYNKLTNSNKKFAIITDNEWNYVKNDYIKHLKNNDPYVLLEEPEELFDKKEKDDILVSSAIELFGDIVEVE